MQVVSQDVAVAYRVEVSGWDSRQDFFVEKTDLQWSADSGKRILLSHAVTQGSLLFLRLLDPTGSDRVHPVPYHVERIAPAGDGQDVLIVTQARPRDRAD